MAVRIEITSDGPMALVRPVGWLGPDLFEVFRKAIAGATFDRKRKANLLSVELVPTVSRRLRTAGFDYDVDPKLLENLEIRTAQQWLELQGVRERVDHTDRELRQRSGKGLWPFQRTGAVWLARRRGAMLLDEMRLGKFQPVSEPVLTPYGWVPIGRLEVGEWVHGSMGPTQVTAVYPQGVKPVYRIWLADGRTARCGLDHLWLCTFDGERRVAMLRDIRREVSDGKDEPNYALRSDRLRRWALPVQRRRSQDTDRQGRADHRFIPITAIEYMGEEESVCISVDAADHLYVTNDFILTHNTVQSLIALPPGAPVLVVCPASIKGEWAAAVERWRPQIRTTILSGRDSFRWPRIGGEMVITNYDVLPDVHDRRRCDGYLPETKSCPGCAEQITYENGVAARTMTGHRRSCDGKLPRERCPGCAPILKEAPAGVVGIYDEAHRVKNSSSLRTQRVLALSEAIYGVGGRNWIVTGTPLENSPPELWCLMRIAHVQTEAFPLGWEQFAYAFGGELEFQPRKGGAKKVWVWKEPKPEAVAGIRRVSKRRLRKEVWTQLPPKTWKRVTVPIDRALLDRCMATIESAGGLEVLLEDVEKEKKEAGAISRMRAALATAKIPFLLDYLKERESDEPIVVFSVHREPIDELGRRGWAGIHGDVPAAERTAIVAAFQEGKIDGLAVTIQAAGEGLNLSRAPEAIYVDYPWKSTAIDQSEDRLVHVDRPEPRHYIVLEADHPIDRRVVDVCMRKRKLIGSTVDAASLTEDAPTVIHDEAVARLAREAVDELHAEPGTVRHLAVTEAEIAVEASLQDVTFADLGRDRLASELCEELLLVGLTDKQWTLAAELVASAARQIEQTSGSADRRMNGSADMPTNGSADALEDETMAKTDQRQQAMGDPKVGEILKLVELLNDAQRLELFEELESRYCLGTGVNLDRIPDHVCEFCEEGEEDEEDEEEDGVEGEDEEATR